MKPPLRLLFAGDRPTDAGLARSCLTSLTVQFQIELAETGTRCLERLAAESFDLLLLSDHLPDMNGIELLSRLRADGCRLPAVMVTSIGDEATVTGALCAGAANYISEAGELDERERMEEALRASEARYRNIVQTAEEGIWTIDGEARTSFVNRKMAQMLGYSADEMQGRALFDFMDDEGRALAELNLARRQQGITEQHEFKFLRKDGSELLTLLTANPILDAQGAYVGALAMATDITERSRGEAVLREGADRLRLAVQAADVGLWDWDIRTNQVVYSSEWKHQLGYAEHEIGNAFGEWERLTHPEDLAPTRERMRESLSAVDGTLETEFRMRHKDGSWRWIYTRGEVSRDGEGKPVRMLGCHIDTTERRQAEELLRTTEAHFRGLFENSPICLWEEDLSEVKLHIDRLRASGVTDMRAHFQDHAEEVALCLSKVRVLDVNHAALQLYQANSKAELLTGLERILTPESYVVLTQELIALAEGHTVFESEATDQTLKGKKNYILLKCLIAPGCEATWSRVYISIVDITARKQAEEKIRKLASFAELNPNPVLEFTADGALSYENPASQAMAKHVGARELVQLLPTDTAIIVRECLDTSLPRLGLETRHGPHTLSWSFHPIALQGTVHCYVVNISERLLLEEQLRQSQKMDAIGQLAGGVAHDFNNLLTVLYGNTAMLQTNTLSHERRAEALEQIEQATQRAAGLTRQLLTFSRRQAMELQQLDVNEVVTGLAKMLDRILREDVRLQLDLQPKALLTRADAGMLEQVLMNLVVNACDAMPGGGQLVIESSQTTITSDRPRQFPGARPGLYVCLRVIDTGGGIPPENVARIFEPFFTTKEAGKGTGLGLATVFGIVKQHGGTLAVTSKVGHGTAIAVLLPATGDTALSNNGDAIAVEPHGGGESVLLVEDEEPVRLLLQRLLETRGYGVQVANSGVDALRMWTQSRGRFDLLITDIIMPGGVSGPALAKQLCTGKPSLKVIYMSGYTGDVAGRGIELQEGANFLQKPFAPVQLLQCVRACLDKA
jgi:two-component system cell cycle sensor histidine kinase/response regulator CckA